jgi:tRNA G18 (ribose-2'-O)-methylase SpoU
MKGEVAVLLHNIRSAYNVGSIFRTADAAGVSKIFLSGYAPRPTDRFGRAQNEIAKTALGAETFISWEYAKNPITFVKRLRKEGWQIVGVEQDKRAAFYGILRAKGRTNSKRLYVFGNEVRGLSKNLRDACDVLVEIPMRGKKESLNVAVTAGIILFNT